MNVVVLVGRLAGDPEVRQTNNGSTACNAILAVDRPYKEGEERQADFIRLALFGKVAETFGKYMTKGRQVAVEGRINTGSYKNKNGDTVYTTDVIVNRFDFIGNKAENAAAPAKQQRFEAPAGFEAMEEELPFF